MNWHLLDGEEICHVGKKVPVWGDFDTGQSLYYKSIALMFKSSLRDEFTFS